jgi:hypothetical protein
MSQNSRTTALLAITSVAVMVAFGLLTPAVRSRPPSNESRCQFNLQLLAGALREYYDDYGALPPSYVVLPYLYLDELSSMYDFSQPWDSGHNRKLLMGTPYPYRCPACGDLESNTFTNYVAVVGSGTIWESTNRARELDAIEARESPPIVIVEIADSDIHWTEPRDLDVASMSFTINDDNRGFSSRHSGGAHALRCGGETVINNGRKVRVWRVDFLQDGTSPDELRLEFNVETE